MSILEGYPTTEEILSTDFLEKYKNKQPRWGFNGLGYITYKRTYARTKSNGTTEEWFETVERCIRGAQKIGACYTKDEAERLYDHIFNLRCNFGGRMLWQLGTSTVDRFGLPSLCNCFSYDTEIITDKGIKKIGDLAGTFVNLMSEHGQFINSEIKCFGIDNLYQITLSRGTSSKTIKTTLNHRWFRWARRHGEERKIGTTRVECTTKDLMVGDKLVSVHGQSIKNINELSTFGIAHGIVFGDGSQCNNNGQIKLCGPKNQELICYFNNSKHYNYDNGDVLISNLPTYFKDTPSLDLDKHYLYGWLAGYFAADGSIKEDGQIRIASSSLNNLNFVRDVCIKLGITYTPITMQERIGLGQDTPSKLYSIGLNGSDLTEEFFLLENHRHRFINHNYRLRQDWKVVSIENLYQQKPVYCAVVPKTHSFALEGNILTGNCWYVNIDDPESFCFLFEHLMLGGGVGYSVKREHVHELPKIKSGIHILNKNTKDADFIVPDSREGWVQLLRLILDSYFKTGKSFSYSTILIRGYGEPISGFGGTASGPQILIDGLSNISQIFESRSGKKLRSIDALDICNILGSIVVAGNVRRSAQIAIGDADDVLFLRAKRWDLGNIPNWRAMSNNTTDADDFSYLSDEFWRGYKGDGEPYGIFNRQLCQDFGRLIDGPLKKKDKIWGLNPCGEANLEHGEPCDLAEIYLNNINDQETLNDCARLLYKTQKVILTLPSLSKWTNEVVKRNMRIGLGVTGVCEDLSKINWLDDCYKSLRKFDKEWSKIRGWNESIKLTVVKPSGTLSLLAGCTPGVHPAFSKYYIRRIRMSSSDQLVNICKNAGCHTEYQINFDGSYNHDTIVVEFPAQSNPNAILAKNISAIDQLNIAKQLQTCWADQSVSVTVYYKLEELDEIKNWLKKNYQKSVKSVSFLLHQDHGFKQAPYEEITEEQYNKMMNDLKSFALFNNDTGGEIDSVECAGGACPVR